MTIRCLAATLLLGLTFATPAWTTEYHVGPGQALSAIGDVPWATLQPGDQVLIYWRATPYKEKWVINRRGTPEAWITIRGVPGPQGQLPVIDGRDAMTAPGLNFWNEERGIVKIGGSNTPPDGLPAYIVIENLEIRSGRPPFSFINDGGGTSSYASNAASIYIEKAEHLIIRGCTLHDSGNGIFSGAFNGQTRDHLIEGNHLFGNGNEGSAFHHNAYTSAIGIVYQYNRFGALRSGADGNNLKDRSAGLVVRYNWIEDGNRQLDLVDGGIEVATHPDYDETFVYGNVLIESDGQGNSQVVHYGGDGGDTSLYRKGTLYFYNNTVISTRSGNTTLLRLSTQDESADVRNSVLYTVSSGDRLAMLDSTGELTLRHNWTKPDWRNSHGSLTGTIDDDGSGIVGNDPGFIDEAMQNFRPASGVAWVDAGTALHTGAGSHPVLQHYVRHQAEEPRPDDGILDIGAYEFCPAGVCAVVFMDGFESGNTSLWSVTTP